MADRLQLARAFEDAGLARDKAEHVASVVFDAIHDHVATKADVAGIEAKIGSVEAKIGLVEAKLEAKIELIEHRLLTRLGGLIVVNAGILFAALHYWPTHG